jgi:ketosteroid isomerase-like protein
MTRSLLAVLALTALVSACSRDMDQTIQAANVKESLDSLWTQFAVAADQRDSVAFGALFEEEAALAYPHAPTVAGRSAIEQFLVAHYTPIDVTAFRVTPEDLTVNGTLAAQAGSYEQDYIEGGAKKTEFGRFTLIAEHGTDHRWRIRRLLAMPDTVRAAAE